MFFDIYTDYSLLNSLIKIENVVKLAKEKGWSSLGIADNDASGLLDFYLECSEAKIKPILGVRFFITNTLDDTTDSKIILYAQNLKGYHNLLLLSSKASIEGYSNGESNLSVDWLEEDMGKDLICVLPIGESPHELHTDNSDCVIDKLKTFFKGKLFYGLYNRNCSFDDVWLRKAEAKNIPYIYLSGAKYAKTDDSSAYKVLRAINEKNTIYKMFESVWRDESIELAEKNYVDYKHKDYTEKFLSLINLDIPTPGLKVPQFPIPDNFKNSYDYLIYLCRSGYKKKEKEFDTPEKKQACSDRMKTELDVIKRCNLSDYFLLVYDICQYCDNNNIPRGIGRGSVGGCLIAFLMDICMVNPLDYNLLFERFLNEDRTKPVEFNGEMYLTDAPDVDLDVGQMQRQQIIESLRVKYGNVAKIATYTTLSAKACIKDVIRAHGRYEWEAARVASYIEIRFGKSDSLEKTYIKNEKFKEWVDKNRAIYEVALKLQDVKKNASIHAAGLIISNQAIERSAPLFLANSTGDEFKQDVCSAYSLDISAKAALLKMDLLGIRSLNVLQDTVTLIGKVEKIPEIKDSKSPVWKQFVEKYR